jgi:hypothetical protein
LTWFGGSWFGTLLVEIYKETYSREQNENGCNNLVRELPSCRFVTGGNDSFGVIPVKPILANRAPNAQRSVVRRHTQLLLALRANNYLTLLHSLPLYSLTRACPKLLTP